MLRRRAIQYVDSKGASWTSIEVRLSRDIGASQNGWQENIVNFTLGRHNGANTWGKVIYMTRKSSYAINCYGKVQLWHQWILKNHLPGVVRSDVYKKCCDVANRAIQQQAQRQLTVLDAWNARRAAAEAALRHEAMVRRQRQWATELQGFAELRLFLFLGGVFAGASIVGFVGCRVERWQTTEKSEVQSAQGKGLTLQHLNAAMLGVASEPVYEIAAANLIRKNSHTSIRDVYKISDSQTLGNGSFGTVHHAVDRRTGIERAVKKISKRGTPSFALQREVEALQAVDHPNVCSLVEYFENENTLWLVMELCRGGDLCSYLLDATSNISEANAALILLQMLRAIQHCHECGLVHRDLKPENFLFASPVPTDTSANPGLLKLIDFGFSVKRADLTSTPDVTTDPNDRSKATIIQEQKSNSSLGVGTNTSCPIPTPYSGGTLLYMSPQALRGGPALPADDIWSIGVTFHILLTGRFPFSTNDEQKFKELVGKGQVEEDVLQKLQVLTGSAEACDLARRLLHPDLGKRISVAEALEHPFLAEAARNFPKQDLPVLQDIKDKVDRFSSGCQLRRLGAAAAARIVGEVGSQQPSELRETYLAIETSGAPAAGREVLQGASLPKRKFGYSSLVAAMMDPAELAADGDICRAVFEWLDADHDGRLSHRDLQQRLGISSSESVAILAEAWDQVKGHSSPTVGHDPLPVEYNFFVDVMTSCTPSQRFQAAA